MSAREAVSMVLLGGEDPMKTVRMSHVEILEVDDSHRRSRIFIYPEAEIIDPLLKIEPDQPENIYKLKRKPKPKTGKFLSLLFRFLFSFLLCSVFRKREENGWFLEST